MAQPMTEPEFNAFLDTARAYYEALASFNSYKDSDNPAPYIIHRMRQRLNTISVRLYRLKSLDELERARVQTREDQSAFSTGASWKIAQ